MRTSLLAGILTFATSNVLAQSGNVYNVTSKPFSLVLHSSNATLDGTALYSCHEGAAIDGLCVGAKYDPATSDTFYFNTSFYDGIDQSGKWGKLTKFINSGSFIVPQTLSIISNLLSNVAIPLFFPSDSGGDFVKFDGSNRLVVPGSVDDSVSPIDTANSKDYYRWYVCDTYYGYRYFTLAWVLGNKPPQNPSCQKVDVVATVP